ncbi:unnamed protein product [Allacma fusca]|uniref:Uncharacterized protein n=1 Tax=Allacma fusca TaxID=39272 RepID=A0A8J2PX60_9HEXA|nr:unnamed protein product [Allacma fusca]
MPTLVTEVFLRSLRDARLLKICRNADAVVCLLPQDKAENLKSLDIIVSGISRKHLFCRNVSPVLEDFATDLPNFLAPDLIFPNLKSIRIEDTMLWSYFTPIRFPSLVEIIFDFGFLDIKAQNEDPHRGLPIERIPRRKSITDFLELETIKFGGDFVMDPLMLRHSLPRVPKLRQIYFFWNESLSAPLLRDYLGHLERIVIWNPRDHKFQVAMAQVAEMVPNYFMQ